VFVENCTLFDIEKSLVFAICKECVVEAFGVAIMSSYSIPFLNFFSPTVLPKLVEKTKETYVLPLLHECYCVTTNFDLWMSKGAHDVVPWA
jgi:hypothetical protein